MISSIGRPYFFEWVLVISELSVVEYRLLTRSGALTMKGVWYSPELLSQLAMKWNLGVADIA